MKKRLSSYFIPLVSFILTVVIVCISLPVSAQNKNDSSDIYSEVWKNKIESTLYTQAEKKDGKYLVYLQNEPVSADTLHEEIKKKTRFDPSLYETEKFNSCIIPELEQRLLQDGRITRIQSPLTDLVLGEPASLTIEQMAQEEMNAYIMAKRGIVKELNSKKNDLFVEKYIEDELDIVFKSRYTSTIIAYLTKEEIERSAQSEETICIMACPEMELVENDIRAIEQIGADSSTGTQSSQFNSGWGYDGTGVKIGILELGAYDSTHPQLVGIHGSRLCYVDNVRQNESIVPKYTSLHATCVTALIVGQPIEIDDGVYTGVVPGATVFQTSITSELADLLSGIEALYREGVSVINCSVGYGDTNPSTQKKYNVIDLYVDNFIGSNDISFVVAAGNEGSSSGLLRTMNETRTVIYPAYVNAPGKAYNAITVGSATTKNEDLTINSPYSIHYSSSYELDEHLSNKPDISAPGVDLKIITQYHSPQMYGFVRADGTSFAAPLVVGVVAQLHQADASLKINPTATKAILLAGADFDAISGEDNDLWDYCYAARVKSGVGFLNAERAVRIAEAGNYQYSVYFMNAASSRYVGRSYVCDSVYIPANYKIRIVMTYSKPAEFQDIEDFAYGNNLDLDLFYQDGSWCDSSMTIYNNVEVIEYVVNTAGTYRIEVYVDEMTQTSTRVLMDRSVAWYIEPAS